MTCGDPDNAKSSVSGPKKLATLIISSLEGAVMLYRLERNEEALRAVQSHLDTYLETEVRVRSKWPMGTGV
jgi:hypothetical protein